MACIDRRYDNSIQTKVNCDGKTAEGAAEKEEAKNKVIIYGPWGGWGGKPWDDGFRHTGVRSIMIMCGDCIDSIRVTYDKNGTPAPAKKHGDSGGTWKTVDLQWPEEYLIGISGYYDAYGDDFVVRSLKFKTNKREFGPFGEETGTPFASPNNIGRIVGFKGRSGWYLDQISIYGNMAIINDRYDNSTQTKENCNGKTKEAINKNPKPQNVINKDPKPQNVINNDPKPQNVINKDPKPQNVINRDPKPQNVINKSPKPQNVVIYGPWGGSRGNPWDDGWCYTGVREINIKSGGCIDSIHATYDQAGKPIRAPKHGGDGGFPGLVNLEWPFEYLIGISGYFGNYNGNIVVRSLTFISNWRKFGPFGVENGTPFYSPIHGGSIVGFFGRSGQYLGEIGIYVSTD